MPSLNGQTILIVDDERFVVDMLKLKLEKVGAQVIPAYDASTAFELACKHLPQMLITDYAMPDQSGYELARKLNDNPVTRDIPVIMLTGREHTMSPEERSHFEHLLGKPFSFSELMRGIELLILMNDPSSAKRREHARECVVTARVFVEVHGQRFPGLDVSEHSVSFQASTIHDIGQIVKVTLHYGEQTYSGKGVVRSAKSVSGGDSRYGLYCPDIGASNAELVSGLKEIYTDLQHQGEESATAT